ncbi:MAG: hypothetical protein NT141_01505 [candidate division WWE3 bacterium]|nr:hypothetical protein [candidate division WWE3 bacterium]
MFPHRTQAAVSLQITNFPSEIKINSEFQIEASVSGLPSNKEAALKIGVAGSKDYYGYGQIKNGDKFIGYNDTGSCNNTLMIKTDNLGHWEGNLIGKISTTAEPGDGKLRIRVCDPDKSSVSYAIKLTAMDPLPIPEPPPKTNSPEANNAPPQADVDSAEQNDATDATNQTDQSSDLIVPTIPIKPTQPTHLDIKLPATFSAQEVPKVAGASTTAKELIATPEAQATPSSRATNKYVIILGSLGIIGIVIIGVYFFLKRRQIIK